MTNTSSKGGRKGFLIDYDVLFYFCYNFDIKVKIIDKPFFSTFVCFSTFSDLHDFSLKSRDLSIFSFIL